MTACDKSPPQSLQDPDSLKLFTVGVGSRPGEAEPALALVGGSHAGRWNTDPLRIPPDLGKVCEYGIECPQIAIWVVSHTPRAGFHVASGWGCEDSGDILEDHQSGL